MKEGRYSCIVDNVMNLDVKEGREMRKQAMYNEMKALRIERDRLPVGITRRLVPTVNKEAWMEAATYRTVMVDEHKVREATTPFKTMIKRLLDHGVDGTIAVQYQMEANPRGHDFESKDGELIPLGDTAPDMIKEWDYHYAQSGRGPIPYVGKVIEHMIHKHLGEHKQEFLMPCTEINPTMVGERAYYYDKEGMVDEPRNDPRWDQPEEILSEIIEETHGRGNASLTVKLCVALVPHFPQPFETEPTEPQTIFYGMKNTAEYKRDVRLVG